MTDWRGPPPIGGTERDERVGHPLEFHEYARKIGRTGDDVLLIGASRGNWHVSQRLFGHIGVRSATAGGGTIFGGTSQAGSLVFYLQNPDCRAALSVNGQPVATNGIAVVAPGKSFALVSRDAHEWISLSVPLAALEAAGVSQHRLRDLGLGAALAPRLPGQLSASLLEILEAGQGSSNGSQRSSEIEGLLLQELAAAVGTGELPGRSARCGTGRGLDRISQDALTFIRRRDGLDSNVEDLCRALDVPERSLLRAFHKFFGMGPTQYMKLRRLNRVHCELRAFDCKETTVTGIMTKCGVTELGRFAGAYRELFGESPSETLKRRFAAAA